MLNNILKISVLFIFCCNLFADDNFFSKEKSIKVNISENDMRDDNVSIKQIQKINKKLPFKTTKLTKRFLSAKQHKVKNSKERKMTNNYFVNVQRYNLFYQFLELFFLVLFYFHDCHYNSF